MTARLEIWGVGGMPEVTDGDDLGALIMAAEPGLADGDVVVVTSKVVSKAEGLLVAGTRLDHLAAETRRVVARRGDTQIVETHHGFVMAAAGIDASNVPAGTVALLPRDADASARRIRATLRDQAGVDVAVIISDTMGRPWRDGVIDTAIGAAGLDPLWDLRGHTDPEGHLLEATVIAVADELASAADLVKGKLTSTPVAVIRGFPFTRNADDRGAQALVRSSADDMFRLGTREAQQQLVLDSAPLSLADDLPPSGANDTDRATDADPTTAAAITSAIASVSTVGVSLDLGADGLVQASGEPVAVGLAVGRLLVALAAVGLRGQVATAFAGGVAARVRVVRSSQSYRAERSGDR